MTRVPVAYAGKTGSTKEIAEAIVEEPRERGPGSRRATTTRSCWGSSVHTARWPRRAARCPVWLFENGWVGTRPPTVLGGRLDPGLATGFFDRTPAERRPGGRRDFTDPGRSPKPGRPRRG